MKPSHTGIAFLVIGVFWLSLGTGVYFLKNHAERMGVKEGVRIGKEMAYMEDKAALIAAQERCMTVVLCDFQGCESAHVQCKERYNP